MILFSQFCSCLKNCFYLPYRKGGELLRIMNEMSCTIKFCYRLGKTTPKRFKLMKEDYKDNCFNESIIFKWPGDLKKGCLCQHNSFLSLDNLEMLTMRRQSCKIISELHVRRQQHQLTFQKLEHFAFYTSIYSFSILVLDRSLTILLKNKCKQCCEWKQMLQNDLNFIKTVIAGDETLVHIFDPLTKFITKYMEIH